jgi:excisionase family DNA binding protein
MMGQSGHVLMDAEEVAKLLRVSKNRVYELARQKILPAVRLGRQVRFSREAMDAWISRGGSPLGAQHSDSTYMD